ncbi:MAG: PAS domain S-box protein [Bacteroidetes bacterium]|nr:PAS domain S-box protein [Bacteroidota bacterium]
MRQFLRDSIVSSFRFRLYAIIAGAVLSVSAFIYLYFPQKFHEQAYAAARAKAMTIADISAYSTAPALFFNDSVAVQEVLAAARQNADIRFIIITDQQQRIVHGYRTEIGVGLRYDIATHEGNLDEHRSTVISRSVILFDGQTIGQLYIGLSLDAINLEVSETKRTITVISAIILIIGLTLSYVVVRLLLGPLERMAGTFRRIAQGDFSQHVEISDFAEVNRLGTAFNSMVDDIAALQGELHGMNRTLEERISERTADLQRSVEQHTRTEAALRDSEERFRALVELSPDAIVVFAAGEFTFINPSALTIFRVPSGGSLHGASLYDMMPLAQAPLFEEMLQRIINGTAVNILTEHTFVREDGTEFIAEVAATKLVYSGTPAVQIVIRDISERIRSERKRIELEQQLLHVQKKEIISTLASGLAHDILNILGIIGTSINKLLFMKELTPSSVNESAEQITKATERGKGLVRQLLSFARKSELNFDSVNVNTIVTEITSVVQRTFPGSIAVKNDLAADLPMIRADSNQLHQALLNLCLNARDAIQDAGLITISTSDAIRPSDAAVRDPSARYLCLCVSDDGVGMSDDVLKRIYEPFFTTKNEGTGSGLGMAMVKGIMENHRGVIEIDTAVGKGTTFRLFFPI